MAVSVTAPWYVLVSNTATEFENIRTKTPGVVCMHVPTGSPEEIAAHTESASSA